MQSGSQRLVAPRIARVQFSSPEQRRDSTVLITRPPPHHRQIGVRWNEVRPQADHVFECNADRVIGPIIDFRIVFRVDCQSSERFTKEEPSGGVVCVSRNRFSQGVNRFNGPFKSKQQMAGPHQRCRFRRCGRRDTAK